MKIKKSHTILKEKRQNPHDMIISINAAKAFDKIQHPFKIKALNQIGIKETSLI